MLKGSGETLFDSADSCQAILQSSFYEELGHIYRNNVAFPRNLFNSETYTRIHTHTHTHTHSQIVMVRYCIVDTCISCNR